MRFPFTKPKPESVSLNNGHLKEFRAGKYAAFYRETYTADDEFSRMFLIELGVNGEAFVNPEVLCKWALTRFVEEVDIDGKRVPFSAALMQVVTDKDFGGFLVSLSYILLSQVVQRNADNLEAVKKTSLMPSENSTQGESQSGTPPFRTSI